jgi:DNA repair metallo-beta-lactamase/UBA/TS-N domain
MNSSSDCHEIEGCPHLFIDAFRGLLLRKTSDAKNTFILTHYHGDHYQSLPRDNKYQGPALIHCTPVTAALLREVHQIPSQFVREHGYGDTWEMDNAEVKITFYDANHCPGAAIVLIHLPCGKRHLHCGDMRYSPDMKKYPLLKQAVENREIDLIYLDTTYGHPKHDFCPQSEAIDQIATIVEQVTKDSDSTLILLSCYSIGKEKVLWECSQRANQPIFVSAKKHKMLQCCQEQIDMCTMDASSTNIHVIPMGLAGELWPYFQPNFPACRDYAEALEHKRYSKVIAFLPTGWANGSNWNKKNAVVTKSMPYKNSLDRIDIEIRLVSYSEHSAFTELIDFVTYLKPRKVIPTVYADTNDRNKIVNHFRNLVDTARAKQQFFASMKRPSPTTAAPSRVPYTKKVRLEMSQPKVLEQLVSMGFETTAAEHALHTCNGSLEAALECLLKGECCTQGDGTAELPVEIDSPPRIANFLSSKRSNL